MTYEIIIERDDGQYGEFGWHVWEGSIRWHNEHLCTVRSFLSARDAQGQAERLVRRLEIADRAELCEGHVHGN